MLVVLVQALYSLLVALKSLTCLDSSHPLLLKLPFRGSPDVRHVATYPQELSYTCADFLTRQTRRHPWGFTAGGV